MTDLVERVIAGERRAAARIMRLIDDRRPAAADYLKALFAHTGRAYILGITGSPGSGKSTLTDQLVRAYRQAGQTVGVVAIDPTSPFSGGAILGDRIRMQRHEDDDGVFVRSLATRGNLGGLSRSTRDVIHVMDAMGKDVVIVETVGVGQDEVDVVGTAHTSMVVLVPGMGDEIQAIKAGILEIADVFVLNKADRDGVEQTEREIRTMIELGGADPDGWRPTIQRVVATEGRGVLDVIERIAEHRDWMATHDVLDARRRRAVDAAFWENVRARLHDAATRAIAQRPALADCHRALLDGEIDPYSAAERVAAAMLSEDLLAEE